MAKGFKADSHQPLTTKETAQIIPIQTTLHRATENSISPKTPIVCTNDDILHSHSIIHNNIDKNGLPRRKAPLDDLAL